MQTSTHSSQMLAAGAAISLRTWSWVLLQNEQASFSPAVPSCRSLDIRRLLGQPNTEFSGEPAALPSLVRCNSSFGSARSLGDPKRLSAFHRHDRVLCEDRLFDAEPHEKVQYTPGDHDGSVAG